MSTLLKQVAEPLSHLTKHQRYAQDACGFCGLPKKKTAAACIRCIRADIAKARKREMPRHQLPPSPDDTVRIIALTRGFNTVFDAPKFEDLDRFNWYAMRVVPYAVSRGIHFNGKILTMQNYLLPPSTGFVVDHINGNRLDNRLSNLRFATPEQNAQNTSGRSPLSGYIGVGIAGSGNFVANCKKNKAYHYIGTFHIAEEAALARDEAVLEEYGEFARLNFPEHFGVTAAADPYRHITG